MLLLRAQFAGKLPPELAAQNEAILIGLERGQTAAEVPKELAALYRPSIQPYLISWFRFVPAERIGALDKMLEGEGRTRSDISLSVRPAPGFFTPEHAREFERLGVDQLILVIGGRSTESVVGRMEAIAAELVTPVATG